MMAPATIPFSAEFMVEESCCWYACANSITFFARIMTPTAPITAMTNIFKLSSGFVTALVSPPAARTVTVIRDMAYAAPAKNGTRTFLQKPPILPCLFLTCFVSHHCLPLFCTAFVHNAMFVSQCRHKPALRTQFAFSPFP